MDFGKVLVICVIFYSAPIKGPFKNYIIQAQGRGGSAKRLYWLMWGEGGVKQKMMDDGDVKRGRAAGSLFPVFWLNIPRT